MGENKDSVTNFKLKFPATRDFILGDVDTIEQRQCLYIGECVEVLCFAKCNDVNTLKNETSLQKWSKQICSLQAFTTASAYLGEGIDIRTAENELDATVTPQNHMSNERNCRPFSAGMSEEVKGVWESVSETLLVYKTMVSLENVIGGYNECKIEMVLWSSGIDDLDLGSDGGSRSIEDTHFSRHIVSETVPVCSPPEVRCRLISSGGKYNLFLKVTNSVSTASDLEVDVLKIHTEPADNSLPQSPEESSSHTETRSPSSPRTEPYTIEPSHGKQQFSLLWLESTTVPFVVKLNEAAELFDVHRDSYLYAEINWRLRSSTAWTTSFYRIGNLHIRKPGLVVTAMPLSQPKCEEMFSVRYTVMNNLQDFLSLKLIWSPEKALRDPKACQESYRRPVDQVIRSVVCNNPTVELGESHIGSTLTADVNFQVDDVGVYELGQHMKLNLQYAVPNPGYTIYSAYGGNTGSSGGHQRKGSVSSIQSMPAEQGSLGLTQPAVAPRSHSMTPIQPQGLPRRGSTASMRSLSSVATPTDSSPVHQSHASVLVNSAPPATLMRALSGVQQTYTTHQRSLSQISSPGAVRPPTLGSSGITAQQVLKRNCQVFVL